jgi:fumarate hydratase class II
MNENNYREESDSLGPVKIPANALWGAQTQRAYENFGVSPYKIPYAMLKAMSIIKEAAAAANFELGLLEKLKADAIISACREITEGRHNTQFPVDVFQTGSGTSWNMNINEVIACRANEILGGVRGQKKPVHPNDDVNRGQSSNDVIPAAISLACRMEAGKLIQALKALEKSISAKAAEFSSVYKLGRTHLQDAVPMTLGQEFSAWAQQIKKGSKRMEGTFASLEELALGGTAIGTGINTHPAFAALAAKKISEYTNIRFKPAENFFEAISARDAQIELMGVLNTIAAGLMKIAQDLRLLASGPRSALGEIELPALQPGSSIMPGKVNPVIPEMVIQVAAHIMGKTVAVTIAGSNAPLELNIMQPLIAFETLSSLELLTNTCRILPQKCIDGITADREKCFSYIEWSLAIVTPLALKIGYDRASKIAQKAFQNKKKVLDIVREEQILSESEINELFSIEKLASLG